MPNAKIEDFKYIEECLTHIKLKDDIAENLGRIERALTRVFDVEFKVSITDNTKNSLFIVNVFPDMKYVGKFGRALGKSLEHEELNSSEIVSEWKSYDKWYLELDSMVLWCTGNMIFNAADIAAAMIHEITRIVNNQTTPLIIYREFRSSVCDVNRVVRALLTHESKIQKLLSLATLECCESKLFAPVDSKPEDNIMRYEINRLGYSETYDSLVNRLITYGYGAEFVYKTEKDIEKDVHIILIWVTTTISELEFNKKRLRETLETETARAVSDIVKRALEDIRAEFFEGAQDSYRLLLSEQWNDKPVDKYGEMVAFENLIKSCKRIIKEATTNIFDKNGKLKKISQLDIDVIAVDVDAIETHDDKIYVLDRIYNNLQIVEAGLDYIESGDNKNRVSQNKNTLLDMKKQLEELRKATLATRIIDKQYGVFIKYPKGYEG